MDVLRNADQPLGTHEIVAHILAAGAFKPSAESTAMPLVRGNLSYLHRNEKVSKSGTGKDVRWTLG